ncbi:MAG: cytochrome P450 [Acidimicrobiia bacterium]
MTIEDLAAPDLAGGHEETILGLFTPEAANEPFPQYRKVREQCPVARLGHGGISGHPTVYLSRYEDVAWALRHPEVFSSAPEAISIGQEQPLIPLQVDPPDHAKYRRLLDPEFSPRKMAALDAEARAIVNGLIDTFEARGSCDFHDEFSTPLPSSIFLALMGLPQSDLPTFLEWRDNTVRPDTDDLVEAQAIRDRTGHEITEYFATSLQERRRSPDDSLLSRIAVGEVDGRELTREERLGICHLLLLGGLDTVTATLDCMIIHLARDPQRRRELVDDPTLVAPVVEELLRYETPVTMVVRTMKTDCEMGGVILHAGDDVTLLLGAANADPDEFHEPETSDFARDGNRHLAFGGGPHRCLGSHLARLELRVALEELHRRIPDYRIPDADVRLSSAIRQAVSLPLVWG